MKPGAQDEYDSMAGRMSELARKIPGHILHKGFVAADGEQVTIVEFESEQALQEWRIHPEHGVAKRRDRGAFQRIQIPDLQRHSGARLGREGEAWRAGRTTQRAFLNWTCIRGEARPGILCLQGNPLVAAARRCFPSPCVCDEPATATD